MNTQDTVEKKEMSLEEAMAALEALTEKLENPSLPLSEQVSLYRQGKELEAICQAKLSEAEKELQILEEDE